MRKHFESWEYRKIRSVDAPLLGNKVSLRVAIFRRGHVQDDSLEVTFISFKKTEHLPVLAIPLIKKNVISPKQTLRWALRQDKKWSSLRKHAYSNI